MTAASKNSYFYAIGRRRSASARVRLMGGKGSIVINDKPAIEYFSGSEYLMGDLLKPFEVIDKQNQFDVSVKVTGGGHSGQADAIRLGIAKALALVNDDFRGSLKRADLLGRDPREKERKKFGLKKARKQRQFTKR